MKFDDIFLIDLHESERSDYDGHDQKEREYETLDQIWMDDYSFFFEEIGELVDALDTMYPDNPKAKEAKAYFTKKFEGMDTAKVSGDVTDHIDKLITFVLNDSDPSFADIIGKLNVFAEAMDNIDMFYSKDDIYDAEMSRSDGGLGKPRDEYADRGVSRGDF